MIIDMDSINFLQFPGGELHINGDELKEKLFRESNYFGQQSISIIAKMRKPEDVMKLLLLTDAIKRTGRKTINLIMPYIPYARQDRVANDGEALSIKVFADLINSQHYNRVEVLDPHSDVCTALIDNIYVKAINEVSLQYVMNIDKDWWKENIVVLAPDAGAYKRLAKVIKDVPLIYATKMRDTKTGKLSNCEIHVGDVDLKGKQILVVDDICDGGGTFIMLASEFQKQYPNEMWLYVSHGIFSKGLSDLFKYYSHIYTTDSFCTHHSVDGLTIYKLFPEPELTAEEIAKKIEGEKRDAYYIKHAL